jgi:hypothetical protein
MSSPNLRPQKLIVLALSGFLIGLGAVALTVWLASAALGQAGTLIVDGLRDPRGMCWRTTATGEQLMIADGGGNTVQSWDSDRLRKFAGTGLRGYTGDGGPATAATLFTAMDVVCESSGAVSFTDYQNDAVRRVATNGTISTVYKAGANTLPWGLGVRSDGALMDAEFATNLVNGLTTLGPNIIAGLPGMHGYNGDGGDATLAKLFSPIDVVGDSFGGVYIADYNNQRIRYVTPSGMIQTVVGNGFAGSTGDGGPVSGAQVSYPQGLNLDATLGLCFFESGSTKIRCIKSGRIDTLTTMAVVGNIMASGLLIHAGSAYVSQQSVGRVMCAFGTCPQPMLLGGATATPVIATATIPSTATAAPATRTPTPRPPSPSPSATPSGPPLCVPGCIVPTCP